MSEEYCGNCEERTEFYKEEDHKEMRCSICETPLATAENPLSVDKDAIKEEEWTAKVPPEGRELIQELDHIRLDLVGDFRNGDLKGLLDEFKEIQLLMDEVGHDSGRSLKIVVTAIRKTLIQKVRDKGDIVIPFRDRRGNIIPGRALHLPMNHKDRN